MQEPWWKKSVVYQIYPKSFYDTTGNGVGDIAGIIEKLDYLKKLGVDVVWLTPIYKSPQRDNGYDISDYFVIQEEYGTMEDFDRLITEAHKRDLKIIMDIVVNHTSTEHEWFQEAKKSKDNPYRDFYIWKDQKEDGSAPTNWVSKFGGSAWEHDKLTEQSYLHLFDVTQADLNWENERVRRSVYDMMTFWFEKGVDGFRLDVINLISKDQRFLDDDGSIAPGDGRKFYTDGPRVHEYMREMNQEVFSKYDSMTVGEMSSTTVDHCIQYSHPDRGELSMTFNFHHLKVDYPNGEKWALADFDFIKLKEILSTWQTEMNKGGGWNALFWCNHDQPRVVSRYGNDELYHNKSAKMLAATIHLMQGTPYIYQGEEIGMTNPKFSSIDEYRDVESLNVYEIKRAQGMNENEILEILKHKSRDNSRTPVQWSDEPNAGFTKGTPWINPADNYREINVEKALDDEDSIFYFYQKLIALRKQYDIITYGNYELILGEDEQIFAYIRNGADEKLLVINNFYGSETAFELPEDITFEGYHSEILLSNYKDSSKEFKQVLLRPYESIVYHLKK
ncbi:MULTISPECIES: alpha,alpha-phosphotrehalase [Priestia]|uniref:Alpha,alpha-phosphotrehalase n=3 Tax=Priestia TaxID=2800373 RepID=D5E2A6_PRIM1|nr:MULTISPECIES: alpha,alpha-phosphotrehalase [Priestia]AVX07098.1 alpha,alpha-phosphotrehalase [Bacillus sp. Y-01]KOP73287.1 trehalose-6-phosphate hydrolase [Bacillus sp. FJAT-21351]KQU18876.1 trehalose-6-phosphate hydrolase [Bacillus sp. Leaf75]MBZ5479493.1 alpha,alpha-phosphotrehalase [Bacillus sp. T_4]MCJ7987362.1 alpha,alpha-phosphotrehalase [Priestia sp. OVL9]MDH6656120.1 trehalose-6-phosphate hydrolase [Bacillus sp. PvP124]MDP9578180.1 trehalose-6-phosphate hydrolase [Bacillus sp. 175